MVTDVNCSSTKQTARMEYPEIKADHAIMLRRIDSIDPEDEFKVTMKNVRKNLEVIMEPAVPFKITKCRVQWNLENILYSSIKVSMRCGSQRIYQEVLGKNSTWRSWRPPFRKKGIKSLSHYNCVHKIIPVPQAMKIPEAKAAVDKEREKLEIMPAWQLTNVRSKKKGIQEAHRKWKTVHFATLVDVRLLKNAELESQFQEYKGRVVLQGDSQDLTQYSQSKDHQRHRWAPQK